MWSEKNLQSALKQVLRNGGSAGVHARSVAAVQRQSEEEIAILHRQLRAENYNLRLSNCVIPKPGSAEKRPLGIPTVRDRIVQAAIRNVIEPIFERDFAEHSYGFRPGRGCKDALRRVDGLSEGGLCPRGGRRPERLLRLDPARPADGTPREKDRRRPRAVA